MSRRPNISEHAFDGAAAWAALPPHVQARIGAAAVELGVALAIVEHADYPARRAGDEAVDRVGEILREAVIGYDGVTSWWEGGPADPDVFRLPSSLGMICRACGCSHNDPCDEGCGWHADGLCTACAEGKPDAGVEAAAVPDLDRAEARAVVRGACRAVGASPLAEPVQPLGGALRDLVRAIDDMHAEIEGGDDGRA